MSKNSGSMVADMVRNDPEVRKFVEARLAAKVASAQSELERALEELKAFGTSTGSAVEAKTEEVRANRSGRPAGSSPGHGAAILLTLRNKHNGLSASDIVEALAKKTNPSDLKSYGKTIRTYLSKMAKDERLVKVGENPTFYKLAPKKAQEPTEVPTT